MRLPVAGAIVLALTVVVVPRASAQAASDSARFALARAVVEKSGVGDAALDGFAAGIPPQVKAQLPGFIDSLVVRLKRVMPEMKDSMAVVYASRFSSDELRQLSAFYDSPIGMKFAREAGPMQGEIMIRTSPITTKIGQDLVQQMMGGGQ
jgi:hypothetical protein